MKVEMNDLSQKEFSDWEVLVLTQLCYLALLVVLVAFECKSDETKIKKPLHSGRFSTKLRF